MNEIFLDRLREATIEPHTVDVDAMLAATTGALKNPSGELSLAFVRVAHKQLDQQDLKAMVAERLNRDRGEGDPLVTEDQPQLLMVLAALALISAFERTDARVALTAALAVRCASHLPWRPAHPDLDGWAASYLDSRAVAIRADDPPARRRNASGEVDDPLASLTAELKHSAQTQARRILVQREQQDVMWWMATHRSIKPLHAAEELNALTALLPGPLAATQFLSSRLGKDQAPPPESNLALSEPPIALRDFWGTVNDEHASTDLSTRVKAARKHFDRLQLQSTIAGEKPSI